MFVCIAATPTALLSPSVLVVEDVPAAAIAVPVVLVVLLLVIGVVVLGVYFWKKSLKELINTADQFYQFFYICYHSGHAKQYYSDDTVQLSRYKCLFLCSA